MDTIVIEVQLPPERYEQLETVAQIQRVSVAEVAQKAVVEWLDEQARLDRARALMRTLGQGLGEGPPQRDVARNHDAYLYLREQV